MFSSNKKNPTFRWVNCLNGTRGQVDQFPFRLPAGSPSPQVEVQMSAQGLALTPLPGRRILVNGQAVSALVTVAQTSTLQLEDALLVLSLEEADAFADVLAGMDVAQAGEAADSIEEPDEGGCEAERATMHISPPYG